MLYAVLAIAFNISYIIMVDKNNMVLFDAVFADWTNNPFDE
jgi:hypothetical protein